MKKTVKIIEKKDEKTTIREDTVELPIISCSSSHLCSKCVNLSAIKCQKVFDIKKLPISNYPFITEGYQIIDERGNLLAFLVTSCNNYKSELRRHSSLKNEENYKNSKSDSYKVVDIEQEIKQKEYVKLLKKNNK